MLRQGNTFQARPTLVWSRNEFNTASREKEIPRTLSATVNNGTEALAAMIERQPTCVELCKALVRCGKALELLAKGDRTQGLNELCLASGCVWKAAAKDDDFRGPAAPGTVSHYLERARQFLGRCIEDSTRFCLNGDSASLGYAMENLHLSVVVTSAASRR